MAKITRQFVIDTARSVAATGVTAPIDVSQDDGYCVETVFTGLGTGASGTSTLQVSVNGTTFSDYPSSGQSYTSTTSSLLWEVDTKRHKFMRMQFSAVAGTGSATTTFYGETFTE
jgi:hypothetical protein